MNSGIAYALLAATLFGASTPFAKILIEDVSPIMLAALLYLGSGIGLFAWRLLRRLTRRSDRTTPIAHLRKVDLPWLIGAIVSGGVAAPILLMWGLINTSASTASLLLNMEGVLTALTAWFVFRENFDWRVLSGMMLIVAGGVLLSWQEAPKDIPWSSLAIIAACLCWAIDNNLTRKVSAKDSVQIASIKGLAAGLANLGLAVVFETKLPDISTILPAVTVGFFGYGISLVMFVIALRHLGAARTGAYFSIAPFIGAAISVIIFNETPGSMFWVAAILMSAGVWLHLTETHKHEHNHPDTQHSHLHLHDESHCHVHDFPCDSALSHIHDHDHEGITHDHEHFPDVHHRHRH